MQINFTGHHMDVTPALKNITTEKLQKLQRHFEHINQINVTFGIEKINQVVEATVGVPGEQIVASAKNEDMYSAIDALVDKLDRQIIRYKEKMTAHRE